MNNNKKMGIGFGVMLLRDGKVLLGQRHEDPAKADSELQGEGTWTLPGGKLEFKESFEDGTTREVMEETGITINPKALKLISVTNDIKGNAHFVTIGFLCEDFQGEAQVKEPDEITQWQWFNLDNLPNPMFFPSEKLINNYKAGKIYQY
jgi:8-oxo-dGTP diphosphatase